MLMIAAISMIYITPTPSDAGRKSKVTSTYTGNASSNTGGTSFTIVQSQSNCEAVYRQYLLAKRRAWTREMQVAKKSGRKLNCGWWTK
jgi:hypothetical protein